MNSGPFNGTWSRILSDENDTARAPMHIHRRFDGNMISIELRTSGNVNIMGRGVSFTPNQWHHIVFTYNGTILTPYIDGIAGPSASSDLIPGSSTRNLELGRMSNVGSFWNGSLDEVRIYNRVLSASEVRASFNAGR